MRGRGEEGTGCKGMGELSPAPASPRVDAPPPSSASTPAKSRSDRSGGEGGKVNMRSYYYPPGALGRMGETRVLETVNTATPVGRCGRVSSPDEHLLPGASPERLSLANHHALDKGNAGAASQPESRAPFSMQAKNYEPKNHDA